MSYVEPITPTIGRGPYPGIDGAFFHTPALFPEAELIDGHYDITIGAGMQIESAVLAGGGHTSALLMCGYKFTDPTAQSFWAAIRPYNPVTGLPIPGFADALDSRFPFISLPAGASDVWVDGLTDTGSCTAAFVPLIAFALRIATSGNEMVIRDPVLYLELGRGKVPA